MSIDRPLEPSAAAGAGGPVEASGPLLFDFVAPSGVAGLYTPDAADAHVQDGAIILGSTSEYSIDANGYCGRIGAYNTFFGLSSVPAKTTSVRKYTFSGKILANHPNTGDEGLRFAINYASWNDNLSFYLSRNGSGFSCFYGQTVSSSWVLKGIQQYSGGLATYDCAYTVTIYDNADEVFAFVDMKRMDGQDVYWNAICQYKQASRPLKANTGIMVGGLNNTGAQAKISRVTIEDV